MNNETSVVVIDADSLIYLVGYENRDLRIEALGMSSINDRIRDIFTKSFASNYIGFFGKIGGRNFRYDIAKTVPYKNARNRRKLKEKEDIQKAVDRGEMVEEPWLDFWEPVLKDHLETFWGFVAVDKIEADDAVIIAAKALSDKFDRVVIASPDKDLMQCPGLIWNYGKNIMVDIGEQEAYRFLALQLATGDGADSIPGLMGVGEDGGNKLLKGFTFKDEKTFIKDMENMYIEYYTKTVRDKTIIRQQKEYLAKYKVDNSISRLTAKLKSKALEDFVEIDSELHTEADAIRMFKEMYALLHMLDTEEAGKEHGFVMPKVRVDDSIDWNEVIQVSDDILSQEDLIEFDFLDEL